MRLRPLALAFAAAFAAASPAWAQMQLTSSTGPALESLATGAGRQLTTRGLASGLKLGDEAILHAMVFADLGYDSNVFYNNNQTVDSAPVLHVGPRLEITNAGRDGSIPSGTFYDAFAGVDWVTYLTNNSDVTRQNTINPSLSGTAEFSSGQAMSGYIGDTFTRYQQAPYTPGEPITRDDNMFTAGLKYSPGGGRLNIGLRYTNLIDNFEGAWKNGSNMGNEGVLDAGWRWLPRTSLYVQVAQGVITYLHSGTGNSTSYPLRTLAGIRGLLTDKLGVNIAAGYSNAFYSSIGGPSGFGNVGIVTEVSYNIGPLSKAGIGYRHDFANSPFVGQYYNMDAVYGAYQQMVASRLLTNLFARYENRRFGGATGRTDNYMMAGVSVDYVIGNFFLAGASYTLGLNRTSQAAGTVDNTAGVDYTKHVLLLRVGVVY